MELRNLKTFLTVVKTLNFHRAAEELHYAQSTVSTQIQDLEDELGARLFDRLGRKTFLTEAGSRLQKYARKMVDLEEEARTDIIGEANASGSLTIRAPESFCVRLLSPIAARYRRIMPKTTLRFITCAHEGLVKDLNKGVTDLAFLLTDSFHSSGLEVEALDVESLILVAAPAHELARKAIVKTSDLSGAVLLLSRADCSYRRLLERMMAEADVAPSTVLEMNSVAAIKRAVGDAIGIAIIPRSVARDELEQGRLVALPWEEEEVEVALLMIWRSDKWMSRSLATFMKVTREVTQNAL